MHLLYFVSCISLRVRFNLVASYAAACQTEMILPIHQFFNPHWSAIKRIDDQPFAARR